MVFVVTLITGLFPIEFNFRIAKGRLQPCIPSILASFGVFDLEFYAFNASDGRGRDKTSSNSANAVEMLG